MFILISWFCSFIRIIFSYMYDHKDIVFSCYVNFYYIGGVVMSNTSAFLSKAASAAIAVLLFFSGCSASSSSSGSNSAFSSDASSAQTTESTSSSASDTSSSAIEATSGTIYVKGYDWGPGVPKVIITLPEEVSSVSTDGASITTADKSRKITSISLSDKDGNLLDSPSKYVVIEMQTTNSSSGSPFTYDFTTYMNNWSKSYKVKTSFNAVINGESSQITLNSDCISNRICPDTDLFNERGTYSGSYANTITGTNDDITLQYAAYQPSSLSADSSKNPLIIWLHGQGEGGTDIDIALLGNKVTALAKEDINNQFTSGSGDKGAYVLAVQCPTYWMDGGDNTNSSGDLVSRYTEILMDTIKQYVSSNPDVDTSRIYLGGCSNGGYMTINMLVNYPDYFAAAYPCCEAYAYYQYERTSTGSYKTETVSGSTTPVPVKTENLFMTSEKIDAIKNIPIWFIQSADDTTVLPTLYTKPTYQALLNAGADNCWFSMFENVKGTDDSTAQYMGHWSWIYIFDNQVTGVQNTDDIKTSTDTSTYGFTPSNNGGGSKSATDSNGSYTNLFEWLNAQSK
jgi:predicted peptidase